MGRAPVKPLPALTSLRFVAAALIVLHHSQGQFGFRPGWFWPFELSQAVTFFFVLSGFILTHAYPELKGWGERGRFLLARFARLWPAHLATFVLLRLACAPPAGQGPGPSPLTDALNLLMLHAWVPIHRVYFSGNHPSWSISVEFGFYLCFAALHPYWRKVWPAALAAALALVVALVVCCRAASLERWGDAVSWRATGTGLLYTFPLARLFEFLLGVTTAHLWRRFEPSWRLGRWIGTGLELMALSVAVAAMYYSIAASDAVSGLLWAGAQWRIWLIGSGIVSLPFAVLIAVLACERGWLSQLLAHRTLVLLGEISFALYLLHLVVLGWHQFHATAFDELPGWLVYLAVWAVLLLGSHLLWACLERPLRGWIVGLWPAPGGKPKAPAPARGWRPLAVEAALLAGLLALAAYAVGRPPLHYVSPDAALALARRGSAAARDAHFGGRLALRGADVARTQQGLRVRLAWQSLLDQPADLTVRLVLLGPAGELRCLWDCPPDKGPSATSGGVLWRQKESVPAWLVEGVQTVGVAVVSPTTGVLPVDRGPRDPTGYILLLPAPQ
jgi:peptidoglycan/LPS O-acetylase OafA/YrhL